MSLGQVYILQKVTVLVALGQVYILQKVTVLVALGQVYILTESDYVLVSLGQVYILQKVTVLVSLGQVYFLQKVTMFWCHWGNYTSCRKWLCSGSIEASILLAESVYVVVALGQVYILQKMTVLVSLGQVYVLQKVTMFWYHWDKYTSGRKWLCSGIIGTSILHMEDMIPNKLRIDKINGNIIYITHTVQGQGPGYPSCRTEFISMHVYNITVKMQQSFLHLLHM